MLLKNLNAKSKKNSIDKQPTVQSQYKTQTQKIEDNLDVI